MSLNFAEAPLPRSCSSSSQCHPCWRPQAAGVGANEDAAKIQEELGVVDVVDSMGEEAAALVDEHK